MAFVHGPGLWKAHNVSLSSRPRYSVATRCVESFKPGILNEVTSVEDFDFLVESGANSESLVVIEFYAKWCKKCIKMMPKYVSRPKPYITFDRKLIPSRDRSASKPPYRNQATISQDCLG
mmetsp:Transcript_20406/g.82392  ORF Transcript_20406/g.82392 Transcript_20406/m.82392 type:complete len:120 (-) Transcript_20406:1939-2298(-)